MDRLGLLSFLMVYLCSSVMLLQASDDLIGRCTSDSTTNYFNCSAVGLHDVPDHSHIPVYTETFNLSFNHIINVTYVDYSAVGQVLQTLDLSHNQIEHISLDAFTELKQLKFLDLSYNALHGNSLDASMFAKNDFLKVLSLQRNPLKRLNRDSFTIFHLLRLETLVLSHCDISFIEDDSIDMGNLINLDLSWNLLETVSDDMFGMMWELQTLDLSNNRIWYIDSLPPLTSLQVWNMDGNQLRAFKVPTSAYLDKLEKLYLRNNLFTKFGPNDIPLDLERLTVLDLSGNDVTCDCKMKWFPRQQLDLKGKDFNIPCRYPTSMYQKNLVDVSENDLTCNMPLSKMLLIIVMTVVGFVTLTITAFFVVRRHRRRHKRTPGKGDTGGDYAAVYSREDDDIRVTISDSKTLLERDRDREFDV